MKHKRIGALLAAGAIVLAPLALAGCSSDAPTEKPYEIVVTCKDGSGRSVPEIEKFDIECASDLHAAAKEALAQGNDLVSVDVTYMGRYTHDKAPIHGMLERAARSIEGHNSSIAKYVQKWRDAAVTTSPDDSLYTWYVERSQEKRAMLVRWAESSRATAIASLEKIEPPVPADPHARSSSASASTSSDSGIPMWAWIVGGIVGAIVLFFVWATLSAKKDEQREAQREAQRKADLRRRLAEIDAAYDEKPVDYDAHVAKKAKKKQKKAKAKAQPAAPVSPAAAEPPTVPDAQDVPAPDPQAAPAAEPPAPPPSGSILDQLRKSQ